MKKPGMIFHNLYIYLSPWGNLFGLIMFIILMVKEYNLINDFYIETVLMVIGMMAVTVWSFLLMPEVSKKTNNAFKMVNIYIVLNSINNILIYCCEHSNENLIYNLGVSGVVNGLFTYLIFRYFNHRKYLISPGLVEIEKHTSFKCSNCGKLVSFDSEECPYCNAIFKEEIAKESINENQIKCSNCGAFVNDDDEECPECGAQFVEEIEEKSESEKLIDSYDDLIKLKDLLDREIITKEEFEKMKKKVINKK